MRKSQRKIAAASEDFYNSLGPINRPDYVEDEAIEDELVIDIYTYLSVDEYGDWEYCFDDGSEDKQFKWAWSPDNSFDGSWDDDETGIRIATPLDVVDMIDDVIFDRVPGAKGIYLMEGEIAFPYVLYGREYTVYDPGPYGEDREYLDDNVTVEFDTDSVNITDLQFTAI